VGTWAKATVILKDKMNTIISGKKPDDALYQRIINWPELWNDKDIAAQYKAEIDDRQIHHEKKREHEVMHNVRWAARNPRYAFEKMEALGEQEQQTNEEQEPEDVDVPEDMTEDPVTADAVLNAELEDAEDAEDAEHDEDDDEDDQGGEGVEDDEVEVNEQDEDVHGSWEADDDNDHPVVSVRAASQGPAPFGGYYRV
jgi:general transcription factor 3C polypeptide 5 (transcription factor C subunit 1)